jgi:hypothetical protein
MPICLTLPCEGCLEKFHATFDEDEPVPRLCEKCREEPASELVVDSKNFDPMNPPGKSEFPSWDPDGKGDFHGPASE